MRHFVNMLELTNTEVSHLLDETARLKAAHALGERTPTLLSRVLGLVFEKPSLRTRVSFQAAIAQLGGTSLFLSGPDVGLGSRESVPDFAKVVSQYVDAVVLRTFHHKTVEDFAAHAACPVINGLSDYYHPCQALADVFTVRELFGEVAGKTLVFVGDGNNVARSLAIAAGKLGADFILSAPKGYAFDEPFLKAFHKLLPKAKLTQVAKPTQAVKHADIVYTDVWASMGQEAEKEKRHKEFAAFQVNDVLLKHAPAHAKFMHCLPAHRDEEVTSSVLDSDRSVVFQQACNRMHAQKALLQWLLK
jgi:ornithine carbamoyltransferase